MASEIMFKVDLVSIHPTPLQRAWCNIKSIFKPSTAGLNSEFSFSLTGCQTKAKEPSLPYNITMAGERIDGFMPFLKALAQSQMQTNSSWIWTQVANSKKEFNL